jgi:DNA-binding beta-propeller fold protein YncE
MRRRAVAMLTLALLALPQGAWAQWYLLASAHPNNLIVIDTETDKVVKNIPLEGRGPAMNIAANSAQPQYAYVVNELAQSVAMVDLDEGKQITSFPLSTPDELVRTMALEVNPAGSHLFVHEMPVKKAPGRYEALPNRIRVIDLQTQKTVKTFPAPRQVMAMVFAKDGKRLYVFSVGQDITVFDAERGMRVDTIPLRNRNLTGVTSTDGYPQWSSYQEDNYLLSFSLVVTDELTGQMTSGLGLLDLAQSDPDLKIIELQPFTADSYNFAGVSSVTRNKAYFSYNSLWKIDVATRRVEKTVPLANTYFAPLLHPDGKKLYCGGNWHEIAVFDADTLEPITNIELGRSQTGADYNLRFIRR